MEALFEAYFDTDVALKLSGMACLTFILVNKI